MNSTTFVTFICTLLLLLSCIKIHSQPLSLDVDSKWETGYHPFPEMSRFLNSHSRIHRPSSRPSYSFLGYLCSIADDDEQIDQVLVTFGKKYRSLVTAIIEEDCPTYNQRRKRTTINIKRKNFPRTFLRNNVDSYFKI